MNKPNEPSFKDVYLKEFTTNNPHCEVTVEGKNVNISKPWGTDDVRFTTTVDNHQLIDDLNKVLFNTRFDAIYHIDTNTLEFIYGYLDPSDQHAAPMIDRKFTAHYSGHSFECMYAPPTERLFRLAKCYEKLPSDTPNRSAPQMTVFRDAQQLQKLPSTAKRYFEKRVPRNFFIKPNCGISEVNIEQLARHINFVMLYYDRESPRITINDPDVISKVEQKGRIRHIEGNFPASLILSPINDIILRLMETARSSLPRFSFIYYYQIFEYAGYYYMDEKARKSLRNFLKDPAVITCAEDKIGELFSIFSDLNQNDDAKMRKIIEDYCDPATVWKEIDNDKEFFASEQQFEGGFTCPPLIAADTTLSTWTAMWTPKTFDQLTKIRNALVHARERREIRVIIPNISNNRKIARYLPIIARIAEQVALKTD